MKNLTLFVFVVVIGVAVAEKWAKCSLPKVEIPDSWRDMNYACVEKMKNHVSEELKAALTYLAMGAHFSKDTVNRPGFSKLFFDAASEEREHAIKFIQYLLMRGELTDSEISSLINGTILQKKFTWDSGINALEDALQLEAIVTQKIRSVIEVCESTCEKLSENKKTCEKVHNDYHLVDYLTGVFLDEQLKGQREIAGRVSTLKKMIKEHGQLAEFLFDKKLLNNELL